ncbi:hypothetical protein BC351_10410 [Paenibacillus ferrarius]|uniref:HTH cro/C1-type domain-containing protein n=1 Tax=Paenibacillus ferrarius TaxID=1469647 RepID=A0A1V4H8Q3_9BACL|nr:helix-turn-helix transcriptional regulator [Paenibacillus ferrarius]OPH47595.1 hypothetical protein BC351_10410 [Paenibacillus ferrarius]
MSKITLHLDEILNELGITRNHLAVEAKVRPTTLLEMVHGKTQAVKFDTLIKILDTLNIIAFKNCFERRYTIGDLIKYEFTLRMVNGIPIDLMDDDFEEV